LVIYKDNNDKFYTKSSTNENKSKLQWISQLFQTKNNERRSISLSDMSSIQQLGGGGGTYLTPDTEVNTVRLWNIKIITRVNRFVYSEHRLIPVTPVLNGKVYIDTE